MALRMAGCSAQPFLHSRCYILAICYSLLSHSPLPPKKMPFSWGDVNPTQPTSSNGVLIKLVVFRNICSLPTNRPTSWQNGHGTPSIRIVHLYYYTVKCQKNKMKKSNKIKAKSNTKLEEHCCPKKVCMHWHIGVFTRFSVNISKLKLVCLC